MPNSPSKLDSTESPAHLSKCAVRFPVSPDSFFNLFVKLNKLDQISHFLFLPGMLFNDTLQWWSSGDKSLFTHSGRERHRNIPALRPHPHEGIDIYLLQRLDMNISTVLPQMLIPAMMAGDLVHFHRDFLGETLYIRHSKVRQKNSVLHTLYGHICAIPGSQVTKVSLPCAHIRSTGSEIGVPAGTGLVCPSVISKGQIVGAISAPPLTSLVPAHLHISCAWIDEEQQVEELNWGNMLTGTKVIFTDPLPFLLK